MANCKQKYDETEKELDNLFLDESRPVRSAVVEEARKHLEFTGDTYSTEEVVALVRRLARAAVEGTLEAPQVTPPAQPLREALQKLEEWYALPEPVAGNKRGEGPNAKKHNAKQAAKLQDGKTYIVYDHHRCAFWGPKRAGYFFRKGAGLYDKSGALGVMDGSDRYFTAVEVPQDILELLNLAALSPEAENQEGRDEA